MNFTKMDYFLESCLLPFWASMQYAVYKDLLDCLYGQSKLIKNKFFALEDQVNLKLEKR